MRLTSHLNVPTAGKRQSLYVVFDDLAETCVFSKQSQLSFSCGPPAPYEAGGLPLSRTYGVNLPSSFTYGSLERLRLFASPSCVRFGTVTASLPRSFSWTDFQLVRLEDSSRPGDYADGFAYPPPQVANRHLTAGQPSTRRRSSFNACSGAGMLTCFPSTTPFSLALGTD